MRPSSLLVALALVAAQGVAHGQPGNAPPPPPYYPPPPQSYGAPPPAGLTAEEQELLRRGEISDAAHAGGGILSLFFGFGTGQAVQGRWGDTGWIFTLGEVGSFALIIYGAERSADYDCPDPSCEDDPGVGPIVVGAIGLVVFRVWEIVDAFAGPANHNRKVRNLRMRLGMPPDGYYYGKVEPYVTPVGAGGDDGAVAGIRLRF
jgi:hypothetical protein